MTNASRGDAPAATQAPVTDRERIGMVEEDEDKSTVVARERGNSNNPEGQAPAEGDNASERLTLMRGLAGRLERLEESQSEKESSEKEMACATPTNP
ncbi:hypothetical protein PI124_g8071 [Phytophthora idaei]|nr:hypothetical protein PI125_g10361 [Phytophthora idaei]KAG3129489.1 hypothetical protein PI126_g20947 [Phytophthora idaei]KAG3247227.1 hypothetical protein PI124_g8071 [Phytophthora idaei]